MSEAPFAGAPPLPEGMAIALDPAAQKGPGRTLLGGSPRRLLRLTPDGWCALAALQRGEARSPAELTLGRRLIDAGIAHPRPPRKPAANVAVVIPVRDRAEQLDGTLSALGSNGHTIVVDDGSRDAAELAGVARRHGARLIRLERSAGPAAARNVGLARAETELVAFIDSDCIPPHNWLEELLGHFDDPLVAAVAPRVSPARTARAGAIARFLGSRSPVDMGDGEAPVGPGGRVPFVPAAALVIRRSALAEAFDEELRYGEDVDLVWRLYAQGARVRYDPRVVVSHDESRSLRVALARRFRYGTSAPPLSVRHPGHLAPVVLHPAPTAVAALVIARRLRGAIAAAVLFAAGESMRTRRAGIALGTSARLAGASLLTTQRLLLEYGAGVGLPITAACAVVTRRPALLGALCIPALLDWTASRRDVDPVRWVALALLDNAAYAAGVWWGCLAGKDRGALIPALARRRWA